VIDDRQKHILIVEDSEDIRKMYGLYLSQKGYRVSEAHSGEEGLEKAFGFGPDLVVLDLWLPKISGWEVLRRLKSDERTKHIPVLVITGHSIVAPKECDGFLTKPCRLDQLGVEIDQRVNSLTPTSPLPPGT
jgi:two-component system cell cycle response regulator DivK